VRIDAVSNVVSVSESLIQMFVVVVVVVVTCTVVNSTF